jgi:hypothetical protein
MRMFLQFMGGGLLLVAAGCPSSVPALCDNGACASDDAGHDGDVVGTDGGGDVVQPPAGCDPAAEPKDAPKCVVSDFGVFVDATNGADANAGTKESPVKSIGAALGKLGAKSRVYVCEGTYAEHVKLTSAVSLYGGFACGAWTYSGNKPKVAPVDVGYALEIGDTTADMTVADLSFLAVDAVDKGQSSIAAFVHKASKVVFVRSDLQAGAGKAGADGGGGATGTITAVSGGGPLNASGYAASGTTAGTIKTCTCSSGGTSAGGAGGGPLGAGAPGTPNLGALAPTDGAGGAGSIACNPTGFGHNGADAANAVDASKVTSLGALGASGWIPQAGTAGTNGTPGQGSGGGGGRDATSAGGGGACGGCGGTGGQAGGGGGASVALASLQSTVVLRASTLAAKAAGQGGAGGAKGTGAAGGSGANGGPTGCSAGEGGRGGDGGTGSGGAGGVAVAVLHKGAAPANEGSTLTPGTKGTKGAGGSAGTNDGPDGVQGDVLQVQ